MLGDMTGIGPEISARLLAAGTMRPVARVAVIGDARVLELGCKDAGVSFNWKTYPDVDAIDWTRNEVPLNAICIFNGKLAPPLGERPYGPASDERAVEFVPERAGA